MKFTALFNVPLRDYIAFHAIKCILIEFILSLHLKILSFFFFLSSSSWLFLWLFFFFLDYPSATVTAEMFQQRSGVNSVDKTPTSTLVPDVDLPPTLPMTFGTGNSSVIFAQSGSTGLLPCVVRNLGDGTVSYFSFSSSFIYNYNMVVISFNQFSYPR